MEAELQISSNVMAAIAAVSLRQLQWWDEHHVVSPLIIGHRRVWDETNALHVVVIGKLRSRGVSLQRARRVIRFLQRVRKNTGYLIVGPRDIAHVASEHEVVRAVTGLRSGAHVIDLTDAALEVKEQAIAPAVHQRW